MKAHRTLAKHAERSIETLGMCLSDFAILELLLHRGPQLVNTIGRRIELTSGAITTAIDRLEKRGLVMRELDLKDRRARLISLTEEGRVLISDGFAIHKQAMDRAALGLTQAEREVLLGLVKKLGTTANAALADNNTNEKDKT